MYLLLCLKVAHKIYINYIQNNQTWYKTFHNYCYVTLYLLLPLNIAVIMIYVKLIVAALPAIILHIIGFCLLYKKSRHTSESQRIFLSLSLSEIVISSNTIIEVLVLQFYGWNQAVASTEILNFCMSQVYYCIMIFLTVDRFFELYLNIRYDFFWNVKSTKYLLLCVWTFSTINFIILLIFYMIRGETFYWVVTEVYSYVNPIFDFIFLFVAVVTYGYIIGMIAKRNSAIAISDQTTSQNSGTLSTVASSNFIPSIVITGDNKIERLQQYVHSQPPTSSTSSIHMRKTKRRRRYLLLPTLLILTYIIFTLCPDMFFFFDMLRVIKSTTSINRYQSIPSFHRLFIRCSNLYLIVNSNTKVYNRK